ncbi:MAG: sulfatase [Mangrovibacterium sp.]
MNMQMKPILKAMAVLLLLAACNTEPKVSQPNVIILFSDDAGYADFSMNGNEQIKTPNIDAIAANGLTFTNGYVSGPVCSPSRAGLMTGRYQQRFGHECNIGGTVICADADSLGLPLSEKTFADAMKVHGYTTGMVGKWHLGEKDYYHPLRRGFDSFFGMLGGSSPYFSGKAKRIMRDFTPVNQDSLPYLTDAFGDEACRFIESNQKKAFFLYLSFNAPHAPMQAKAEYVAEYRKQFETEQRAINAAMTRSLDENVGKVMKKLKELGLEENTLVFFLNDNGGAVAYNASCNYPFSGTKGTFLEGGVHVPFLLQWKGTIPAGIKYDAPVISLDIMPTALAAGGFDCPYDRGYDGVNLLPYILKENKEAPHETLFWRLLYHGAVRKGDWKLLWFDDRAPRLYNLADDIGERHDLASQEPEKVQELLNDFHRWEEEVTVSPRWKSHPMWKEHSLDRYNQAYVDSLRKN